MLGISVASLGWREIMNFLLLRGTYLRMLIRKLRSQDLLQQGVKRLGQITLTHQVLWLLMRMGNMGSLGWNSMERFHWRILGP